MKSIPEELPENTIASRFSDLEGGISCTSNCESDEHRHFSAVAGTPYRTFATRPIAVTPNRKFATRFAWKKQRCAQHNKLTNFYKTGGSQTRLKSISRLKSNNHTSKTVPEASSVEQLRNDNVDSAKHSHNLRDHTSLTDKVVLALEAVRKQNFSASCSLLLHKSY